MSLEIRNLRKQYGDRAMLDDVTLTVADGEFLALLGPSGSGKSTILRLVCGIDTSDGGEVWLNGRDITGLPPRERNIGMVFQDYGLYPHMDVSANIAYSLEAKRMPRDEIERRVRNAAEKLDLTPLLNRTVVDLSGGEQQRVAVARAFAKDADLYLYDEPISNLDPKLRVRARRDILMVHRDKGTSTLYVTHDQNEALAIGDRIAIIANGRLQQVGTAEDLLLRPANLFVAGFIGTPSMNLLRGALVAESMPDSPQVTVAGTHISLQSEHAAALAAYPRHELMVGIPPAAFFVPGRIEPEMVDSGARLTGNIVDFEPLISEVIVNLKFADGSEIAAVFQEIDERTIEISGQMQVGIDAAQVRLFDTETEQALS